MSFMGAFKPLIMKGDVILLILLMSIRRMLDDIREVCSKQLEVDAVIGW